MNANICHAGTFPRMRLQSADEAAEAGRRDARALLQALANIENGNSPADLLGYYLDDILSLALNQRLEECQERKAAFCAVVGPVLAAARQLQPGDRIKTALAGRTGRVVKAYVDGSACVCWDDGEPQAEGLGHERIPRHMLISLPVASDSSSGRDTADLSSVTDSEGGEV